jgi:teichuronic acid biosynthesis glycosyltransferase TuaC
MPLRLLTYTTLYPHAGAPNHGVFVENRLRFLRATGAVDGLVVAPVPWVPPFGTLNPAWSAHAGARPIEERHGITIHHPRFPVIPRFGMNLAPRLMYRATAGLVGRLIREAAVPFDLIDAHYGYPDGVAAARLGKRFGLPVVITVRGSDVTEYPSFPVPRRLVLEGFAAADAIITVSGGLRDAVIALGVPADKVTVLRNGVDLQAFQPVPDRDGLRAALGLTGPTLLSVGHLIPRKAHDLVIGALPGLPDWRLLIAGTGPERAALERLADRLNVADRVRFLGQVPHKELSRLYTAADMLVLASEREGWANVLLESMACGTPVLASPIPGNPEVVQERAAGLIMHERSADGVVRAARDLASAPPARSETRAYAERFSWDATSQGQLDVFRAVLARRHGDRR